MIYPTSKHLVIHAFCVILFACHDVLLGRNCHHPWVARGSRLRIRRAASLRAASRAARLAAAGDGAAVRCCSAVGIRARRIEAQL